MNFFFKQKNVFWKDFAGHAVMLLNTLKMFWILKFQKLNKKKEEEYLATFQPQLYLVSRRLESPPSFTRNLPVNCELIGLDVFVYVGVCVWATLSLWFTAPLTLSPSVCWSTAMVKAATMAGYGAP